MTQCPIVAYLSLKGMSARGIHDEIVATLGPDAVSHSSGTRYLRSDRKQLSFIQTQEGSIRRATDELSGQTLRAFC
jgi:hypothetical protein